MIPFDPSTSVASTPPRPSAREDPKAIIDTSRQLEGVFLNLVFEEMAKTVPQDGLFGEAPGLELAQSWLRTEISKQWAASGGTGLGDRLAESVGGDDVSFLLRTEAMRPQFAAPLEGPVTSHFGNREHPISGAVEHHNGVDISAPVGTPVRTPFPGRVLRVGEDDHSGRTVVIEHPSGFQTVFAHLGEVEVVAGQSVSEGQRVARSGNSGRSTGPHLHFALFLNGRAVDPGQWIPALRAPSK